MRTSAGYSSTDRSIVIRVDDPEAKLFGANVLVTKDGIKGWFGGGVSVRRTSTPRLNNHGTHSVRGFRGERVISVEGVGWGDSRAHTASLVDEWNAILADGTVGTFTVIDPDQGTRWANCYLNDTPEVDWFADDTFTWAFDLVCPDPRKYGLDVDQQVTGPPLHPGGLRFDLFASGAPGDANSPDDTPGILDFGLPSFEGIITVTNVGTAESDVHLRVDGPTTNTGFTITELAVDGEGRRIESRLELAPGSWIDIDTATGLVFLDGTADRSTSLTIAQFGRGLEGGETRTYLFNADHPDARLTVKVTPAWW